MARIGIKVTAQAVFDPEQVREAAMQAVAEVMEAKVADKFVEVAKARCPVGKEEPAGTNKRSFKKIVARGPEDFPFGSKDKDIATELSSLSRPGQRAFAKAGGKNALRFFRGVKANRGRTPTEIVFRNNTLKGVFKGTRTPGRLRDSIHYVGTSRRGHSVVGLFAADAEHAAAIHDGFTHRGGPDHAGEATQIAPRPFFDWAVANIEDEFDDFSSFFEG